MLPVQRQFQGFLKPAAGVTVVTLSPFAFKASGKLSTEKRLMRCEF
jgi:hypothetical protein